MNAHNRWFSNWILQDSCMMMHWFSNTLTLILFANSLITPHCEGQLNWVPGNATSPQKPGSSARAANRKYGQRGINEFRGCSVIHSTDLAAASIPKSTHRQVILSSSTNYQDGHSFYAMLCANMFAIKYPIELVVNQMKNIFENQQKGGFSWFVELYTGTVAQHPQSSCSKKNRANRALA